MCVPLIAAGIGVAAAAAGTAISYKEGQNATAAQNTANAQAEQQQNTAFMQRSQAAQQQLASQTAANEKQEQAFSTNQANTQAAQMAALGQTQSTTNQLNQTEQAIATDANNVVQTGVDSASEPALSTAQAVQTQQQQNLNAPVVASIQANNPLGALNSSGGSGPSAQAMAASDAASAKYVQNYGDTQAVLSGYNAPINAANQAAQGITTGLMPVAAADQLLKGSAPSILAPSQLAYTQAGELGQAVNTADSQENQQAIQLADAANSDADDLADLQQSDSGAITQNQLTQAQQRAASLASLGQGLTSIGNTALNYAGTKGAYGGLSKAITGAAAPAAPIQVGGVY
jgi:hypothetical protein